jgi:predicted phage terminase large subunit-like protein
MALGRGTWKPARHLVHLSTILADAVLGNGHDRILVDMPPRHGKSVMCSHYFPVWFLEWWPEKTIVVASYAKDFAAKWGRNVRNTIAENEDVLTVRLSADSKSAGQWNTQAGGGMICVGVGGALTGHGADVLLVDDPIKNRKEANSPTVRESIHDWWKSTAHPRLEPDSVAVVIQARWHEDDVIGRLKANQAQDERDLEEGIGDDEFDRWEHVSFPALCEEAGDVLGREPPGVAGDGRPVDGEPLWPERLSAKFLARKRRAVGPFEWASLYQGHPQPPGNQMFKRSWIRYFRDEPGHGGEPVFVLMRPDGEDRRVRKSACAWFQTADTAEGDGLGNDYTAVGTWAAVPPIQNEPVALLLIEMAREKLSIPRILPYIEAARSRWPLVAWTGVEKKSSGTGVIAAAQIRGLPLRGLEATENKATRAAPLAVYYENGQVYHRAGASWLADYEDELLTFPRGANDDQVDVASHAAGSIKSFGGIRYL